MKQHELSPERVRVGINIRAFYQLVLIVFRTSFGLGDPADLVTVKLKQLVLDVGAVVLFCCLLRSSNT